MSSNNKAVVRTWKLQITNHILIQLLSKHPTHPLKHSPTQPLTKPINKALTQPLSKPLAQPLTQPHINPLTQPHTHTLTQPTIQPPNHLRTRSWDPPIMPVVFIFNYL